MQVRPLLPAPKVTPLLWRDFLDITFLLRNKLDVSGILCMPFAVWHAGVQRKSLGKGGSYICR